MPSQGRHQMCQISMNDEGEMSPILCKVFVKLEPANGLKCTPCIETSISTCACCKTRYSYQDTLN